MNLLLLLSLTTQAAFAADKPSMTSMWLELVFIILLVIFLKVSSFPNQKKLIIFITYILSGIITKTIWLPVLLWASLFYYFKKQQ